MLHAPKEIGHRQRKFTHINATNWSIEQSKIITKQNAHNKTAKPFNTHQSGNKEQQNRKIKLENCIIFFFLHISSWLSCSYMWLRDMQLCIVHRTHIFYSMRLLCTTNAIQTNDDKHKRNTINTHFVIIHLNSKRRAQWTELNAKEE